MLTDAFLSRLDALRLAIRHPAQGGAGGARRSRSLGFSAEFSDFRPYTPGDDVRRLDWNAYARFDKLFMKLFAEEQESAVTLFLDTSASMAAKGSLAIQAGEALAYLALSGGDRLQVILLQGAGHTASPWYTGRRAYPQAAAFLEAAAFSGSVSPADALQSVERLPRGLSLLVTDGYHPGGLGPALSLLEYRKQEAAVLQPLSAFEMAPEVQGALRLLDAEGAPPVDITADAALLRQYQQTLQNFLHTCQAECRRHAAAHVLLDGRQPFEEAFLPALSGANLL